MFSGGKNHRTTEDNRGLTLVELLVAVVIFSIAILPMLYAFVYSTGYNFKAQQTLQSTGIAQAIIEKAKSPGITLDKMDTAILGGTLLDTDVFAFSAGTKDAVTGVYRIENVSAKHLGTEDSVSRRVYDVEIEMSPILSHNTSVIRSMSDNTCNFTDHNSAFNPSALAYCDERAAEKLVELLKANACDDSHTSVKVTSTGAAVAQASWPVAHPGQLITNDDFDLDNLIIRRVLRINCTTTGVKLNVDYYCGGFYTVTGGIRSIGSVFKISKNVTIGGTEYTITCNGGINNASTTYSIITSSNFVPGAGVSAFYSAQYGGTSDFTLYTGATDALFFYYYPGYELDTSSDKVNFYDTFWVKNSVGASDVADSEGTFDMYFYKQLNNTLSDAQLNYAEWNYAPYFKFENTGSGMTVNFYNNLLNDVRTEDYYATPAAGTGNLSSHAGSYANKLQSNGTSSLISSSGSFSNKTLNPTSVPAGSYDWNGSNVIPYESVVTSYNIIVRVYKDGESTPIETMSGEVINW